MVIPNKSLLSLLVLIATIPAYAGGRTGNGTGVTCGNDPIVMLDVYQPEVSVHSFNLPVTRAETRARIAELFASNIDLVDRTLQAYDDFGPSDLWDRLDSPNGTDAFDSYPLHALPIGCRIRPISRFENILFDRPKISDRTAFDALSESQRRVLEMHEAIYATGARSYNLFLPIATREAVSLMSATAAERTSQAKEELVRKFTATAIGPIATEPEGNYFQSGFVNLDPNCPAWISLLRTGGWGSIVLFNTLEESAFAPDDSRSRSSHLPQALRVDFSPDKSGQLTGSASGWDFTVRGPFVELKRALPTDVCSYTFKTQP